MKKTKKKTQLKNDPSNQEAVRQAAYYRWQKRGAPQGDDLADWHAVEKRIVNEEEETEWDGEDRRWEEENPLDDEPGEI